MIYDVTIIVPVYGTEKLIERCARSLFEQTYDNIEYVFVDDATPDQSIMILRSIIDQYPKRKPHCKIIQHSVNKGLGSSRNTGFEYSSGTYVIPIDSDDWCEKNMISDLYARANKDSLDIVICDYFSDFGCKSVYIRQNYLAGKEFESILSGHLHGSCWNKLIKRSLYTDNNVFPPKHISMAEDRHLMIRLFFYAQSFGYINNAYLHYMHDNMTSLTAGYSRKSIDELKVFLHDIKSFLLNESSFDRYKKEFYILTLEIKYYILYSGLDDSFWIDFCPEANNFRYLISGKGSLLSKLFRSIALTNSSASFVMLRSVRKGYQKIKRFWL